MKIAFVWQGVSDSKIRTQWKDGLYAAMQQIENEHTVTYHEPWDDITDVDIILYWEAPITITGLNGRHYDKVRKNPIKKALLFAGGAIRKEWVQGFDLLFVESAINAQECQSLGIPHMTAFGINEHIMKPLDLPKKYDGMMHATFAAWKRHNLFAQALKEKGLAVGRKQSHEPQCYQVCYDNHVEVLEEQPADEIAKLINQSHTVVNTSEYWGGGQRCTLEAMACGVPPIVMTDSPKNREYVEESGFGKVVEPNVGSILHAIEELKETDPKKGVDYINSKWTSKHYAENLLKGINQII